MSAVVTKEEAKKEEKPLPAKQRGIQEAANFTKKYEEALEAARISAEHTATEGWQALYGEHRQAIEKRRKSAGERLREAASEIERGGMSEDLGKVIAEMKKTYEAICDDVIAFQRQVLEPIKQPMHRCHEIIEQARREARGLESASPLISKGVLETVEKAIRAVHKVKFDEESGMLLIKPDDEKEEND